MDIMSNHDSLDFERNNAMGRRAINAKKFIVSCRVNNEEMDLLQSIAKETDSSISDLLRKSLLALHNEKQQLSA
jgi:hypothetical protein